jgi:TonB family protein
MRNKSVLELCLAMLLAGAGGAQAADTVCDVTAPVLHPLTQTHTIPPYPEVSVMTNEQGKTLLNVSIGTDGVPTDVQVAESSGSLRLDEAARDYVKAVWRWAPPVKDCMPVAVKTRVSIAWDLRNAQSARPGLGGLSPEMIINMVTVVPVDDADFPSDLKGRTEMSMSLLAAVISESGAVNVAIARPTGVPELDAKAVELVKTRYHWTPARLNGNPVGAAHLLLLVWTPPGVRKIDPKLLRDMMGVYLKGASQPPAAPAGDAPRN